MASKDLLKQDEKEQGKPKVVASGGKWTPRTEIRWNKHASTMIILHRFSYLYSWLHQFTSLIVN